MTSRSISHAVTRLTLSAPTFNLIEHAMKLSFEVGGRQVWRSSKVCTRQRGRFCSSELIDFIGIRNFGQRANMAGRRAYNEDPRPAA
jgi:hypothetical protein